MVYSHPRHRKPLTPAPASKSINLSALPNELLLEILSYLSTDDVLKTRLCNKRLYLICGQAVHTRLKVLYIHPTTLSLRQAVAICGSGWGEGVREVGVLGKVGWGDMCKVARGARQAAGEIDPKRGYGTNRFKTWPPTLPPLHKDTGRAAGPGQNPAKSNKRPFAEQYAALLQAVAKLPNLHTLSFSSTCEQPGFNQTADNVIQSHALACRNAPERRAQPSSNDQQGARWTELHALFALLATPTCTTLRIDDELPFGAIFVDKLDTGSYRPLVASLERLVSMDLTLCGSERPTEWQGLCSQMLERATNLENLHLRFQRDRTTGAANISYILVPLLLAEPDRPERLQRLSCLRLTTLLPHGEDVRGRTHRPMVHYFPLLSFLESHAAIRSLGVENVIFILPGDENESAGAELTLRESFLQILELKDQWISEGDGRHFHWSLNRFTHHPGCRKPFTSAATHDCAFDCGLYVPGDLGTWTAVEMSELAATRGVALDEESQS